jgi:hypothetical protein
MQTWAKVGLAFIVVVIGAVAMQGKAEVSIKCTAKGDSGSCVIENKGGKGGNVEADVIVVCHDGEHSAHVAARVEANNHVTKIIDGFTPSVGLLTSCAGIDYRNFSVR